MIQCDKCKEWYHGDCVDQKEKDADDIINYYCAKCRQLNPRRYRIKYKISKKEKLIILKTPLDLDQHNICYGIGCTNKRSGLSKYCSLECGQALARVRVMNLLPKIQEKIKNHIGPKIKNNNEKLFKIIKEQQELKNELNFIEQKLNAIEKVEEQAKAFRQELMEAKANSKASSSAADGNHDKSTHPDPSNEMQVFCPVCGTTLSSSNFSKHVEMCYRKIERNLSYESLQKSEIPSSHRLYCDEYDVKDKERKYCKRLWVSCPEHTRKPKAVADEICCCPLDDSFTWCRVKALQATRNWKGRLIILFFIRLISIR